jgi:Flp pilus assembly protein TadB
MHAVQLSFGICFTNDEWKRGYGMEESVAPVAAKSSSRETAIQLAEKRLRESQADRVDSPLKFGLFLVPLLIGAALIPPAYLKVLLAVAYFLVVAAIVVLTQREYFYARELVDRIRRRTD